MKVFKFGSLTKLVSINVNKYKIDWEKDGASKIERQFRDLIYPYWKNKIVLFQPLIPGTRLRLDFLNATNRLCVEIDGPQHNEFNKHFHNNSRAKFLASIGRDLKKDDWLRANNIKLVRLDSSDLDNFSIKYIQEKFDISIL
jgi:hypothetical protein